MKYKGITHGFTYDYEYEVKTDNNGNKYIESEDWQGEPIREYVGDDEENNFSFHISQYESITPEERGKALKKVIQRFKEQDEMRIS